MGSKTHFITVSRAGDLHARRKGSAPICVAEAAAGLEVETDEAARSKGAPPAVRVRFAPGGGNLQMRVMTLDCRGEVLEVDSFLARFEVSSITLGRWIRQSVERALDAAGSS